MSVLVFGLNYRTAPVGLLERLAVAPDELQKALSSLVARDHIAEAVVLSTCNRVEVYAAVTRYHGAMGDLRAFFCEWGDVELEDVAPIAYDYFEDRAAAHLFAVAAGLDSMVVGERQINLQVKHAFKASQEHEAAGRVLGTLFRQSLRVARRARLEVDLSAGGRTMVDAGLVAAERVLGDLTGRRALVVGAGKMGAVATSRLGEVASSVTVANRSRARAEELAGRSGAGVVDLADVPGELATADLVLTSTGATEPVVRYEDVAAAITERDGRPIAFLDLAVPRDVDPACSGIVGVHVLDVDAVRTLTTGDHMAVDAERARQIVEEAAQEFAAWTRTVQVEPTIAAMRARAEEVRIAELERLAGRFTDLDDRQRQAVEALSRGIVNTLLHEPTVRLKQIADHRGAEMHASALRELFGVDDDR